MGNDYQGQQTGMDTRTIIPQHQNVLLILCDMVVFDVAEVDSAALQCTALCACGGNCEHLMSVN